MAALTKERNTREIFCNALNIHRCYEIASSTTIYPGSIVALNSTGKAVPASDTAGLVVVGRAESIAANGRIIVKTGVFLYDNATAATETLAVGDINQKVFVMDDQTAGKVGGTNMIPCGILRDILPGGELMVEIGTLTL